MLTLDTSTEFGAHVTKRLEHDTIVWLTTVSPGGTPHPTPVWFLWNGHDIVLFSQPDKPKLSNSAANPHVALHLDSDGHGGNVVVATGRARTDPTGPTEAERDAFKRKYADDLERLGVTYDELAASYSVTVRIAPDKLRGWT
jgi:PPOX class probable F420-dependent enzyme